jgi:hypothetical protein
MKQATLFNTDIDQPPNSDIDQPQKKTNVPGLVIKMDIGKKDVLSKVQQKFNKLTRKIETLQKEIQQKQESLDDALVYYGKTIHPLEMQLMELRKKTVKKIFEHYKDKKTFNKKDREVLKRVISAQLEDIFYFSHGEPDDEIKKIFKETQGISYEASLKNEMDEMKDTMQSMFEEMGIDVNIDDAENTDEYWARKMKEIQEEMASKIEDDTEQNNNRKKTPKQLQKEIKRKEMEALRERNIKTIYKQLAKTLHPDLEPDETLRKEKEIVMQQLTAAYENEDLHTLLKLELQWIYKESNHLNELSNDKLTLYNDVLKEQVEELEFQLDMLPKHPQYMPMQRIAGSENFAGIKIDLLREQKKLMQVIDDIKVSYENLMGGYAVNEIREVIEACRIQDKMNWDFF